jgi:hypothetical protein
MRSVAIQSIFVGSGQFTWAEFSNVPLSKYMRGGRFKILESLFPNSTTRGNVDEEILTMLLDETDICMDVSVELIL